MPIDKRTCPNCGKDFALPLDGDPTRRCPHCQVPLRSSEYDIEDDRVRPDGPETDRGGLIGQGGY